MLHSEEANNERKEPTGIKKIGEGSVKEKPELEEELDKRFTQPVTACAAFGKPLIFSWSIMVFTWGNQVWS